MQQYKRINDSDIDDVFESIYTRIISNIQKCLRKGTGCINISKYNPLVGSKRIRPFKKRFD